MPALLFNLDALAHNARQTRALAERWGVAMMPVLKVVASHPAAVSTLAASGFEYFGYAEAAEISLFGDRPGKKVLIQLGSPAQAPLVVERFQRSFQAVPETLAALDGAAGALGRPHEVLLMVDLGDCREGLDPGDLGEMLDYARSLRHLSVVGFGSTIACFGDRPPDRRLMDQLVELRRLASHKIGTDPVVSLGGSVFCDWMEKKGPGIITELRLGDPFILGEDIYRLQPLPGLPFRRDVCALEAEVVEIRQRTMTRTSPEPKLHQADGQECPEAAPAGLRLRALLAMGRFHASLGSLDHRGAPVLSRMTCHLPGAVIAGLSASYLALDITDCPESIRVGRKITFSPGYWSIAQAFRNPMVDIRLTGDARLSAGEEPVDHQPSFERPWALTKLEMTRSP